MNGITTDGYVANGIYDNIRGYNGYGSNSFANPSANAVRINAGNRATAAGIENLLDQNQFSATNKNIVDGDARICDKLSDNANRASDMTTNSEFRMSDRLRDVEREMAANARAAAECCCDAKLEACKNTAELKALVISENSKTREQIRGDALNAANAELTALKTQIACGCCPPRA